MWAPSNNLPSPSGSIRVGSLKAWGKLRLVMSGASLKKQLASVPPRLSRRIVRERRRRADRDFTPGLAYDAARPVLVLSPHPDDAVFTAWSVLTGGTSATVVNVFAGLPEPGFVTYWDRICGARDSAEQMRARIAEDQVALGPVVGAPVCLDLLDQQYRTSAPTLAEIHRRLLAEIQAVAVVYAPAAVGSGHPDHRLVRAMARAVARTDVPVVLYADLPYAARYGWPYWVTGKPREPHLDVDAYWGALASEIPEVGSLRAARVVRLDSDAAARKLDCMRRYVTQFRGLDSGGLLSDPETHRYEVFWPLMS